MGLPMLMHNNQYCCHIPYGEESRKFSKLARSVLVRIRPSFHVGLDLGSLCAILGDFLIRLTTRFCLFYFSLCLSHRRFSH
jgi:hypothetical protein